MPTPTPKKLSNGKYQARWQQDGKEFDRTFDTLALAQQYVKDNYHEKAAPVAGKLRQHLKEFLADQAMRGLSASWVTGLSQMLERNFLVYCQSVGVGDTSQLTEDLMRGYMRWWYKNAPFNKRRSAGATRKAADYAATWNMYRQAVSTFSNWAIRRKLMHSNPAVADEFRPMVKQKVPETYDPDEVRKIIEYLDSEHILKGTFIRVLIYTGLRLSEAAQLRWADVNLKKKTIRVKYSRKSDRERVIPISDELLPYLKRLPQKTLLVFDDGHGRPWQHRRTYYADVQRACYVTGIRPRRVHDLRHSFARYLIESGADIVTVQNIMGHENIQTTQKYLKHFNLTLAREAVNSVKLR